MKAIRQTQKPSEIQEVIEYKFQCIHCNSTNVDALTNDGGSIQSCRNCKKSYKATLLEDDEPRKMLSYCIGDVNNPNNWV